MNCNLIKTLLAATMTAAIASQATAHPLCLPLETEKPVKAAPTQVQHPDWSRNAVIYEVNWRQMTPEGTFKGVESQLPRLKDLGVDILWIMPIHPISVAERKGELGSYYAAADYKQVNPEAGDIKDFRKLVKSAHDLGMKVIIDWVPNHTGRDHWWMEYHPTYYRVDAEGRPMTVGDWTDISQLNYENPETRKAMTDAMAFWLKEADIDGFRCDVAGMVPVDYWDAAVKELNTIKPDLFMLAEAAQPSLHNKAFDMGYNWPMASLFREISATAGHNSLLPAENSPKHYAADIDSLLAQQAATYPADSYLMNMTSNHDYNSWEGTEFQRFGKLSEAFAVLSYTLPGMPLIYTGQETGFDHAFEFFKKDISPQWEPRNSFFTFYQKLNELKHNEAALLAGESGGEMVSYPMKSKNLYMFTRTKGNSEIAVIVNLGDKTEKVKFEGKAPKLAPNMVNYFTGKGEKLPKTLAPGEYRLYVAK